MNIIGYKNGTSRFDELINYIKEILSNETKFVVYRENFNYLIDNRLQPLRDYQIAVLVQNVEEVLRGKNKNFQRYIYRILANGLHACEKKTSDNFPVSLRIEMAKVVARKNGRITSKKIKSWGFDPATPEGQEGLIDIAKMAARHHGGMSKYILKYGINSKTPHGQIGLIAIAKLAAKKSGESLAEHIQRYRIHPASVWEFIEIAKLAIQNNGNAIKYIQNFEIDPNTEEGQHGLIEIAKIAAKKNGGLTSKYIKEFKINSGTEEGRNALVEIAKLAAQTNGKGTSEYIQNYGINPDNEEGLKILIEIAKIAARSDGLGISQFIENYGIDATTPAGQKALIEIALLAVQSSDNDISKYIQKYKIDPNTEEGQFALIEIAKFAAKRRLTRISQHIKKYHINSEKALIEIAKLAAQQDGENTSEHIQNYEINPDTEEGQTVLIEIAKLAAQESGLATSRFIKKYRINPNTEKGQSALVEIAKLAAKNIGEFMIHRLGNYEIKNPNAIFDIGRIAVWKDGWNSFKFFNSDFLNGSLKGDLEKIKIGMILNIIGSFLECSLIEKLFYYSDEMVKSFALTPCKGLIDILLPRNNFRLEDIQQIRSIASKIINICETLNYLQVAEILSQITGLKKPDYMPIKNFRSLQLQKIVFLLKAIGDVAMTQGDNNDFSIYAPIIKQELQLRDPELSEAIWEFFSWDILANKKMLEESKKKAVPDYAILSHCLNTLMMGDEEDLQIIDLVSTLRSGSGTFLLKDAAFNKLWLQTLLKLGKEKSLSPKTKKMLLWKALNFKLKAERADKDKIKKALQSLNGIVELGGGARLNAIHTVSQENYIERLMDLHGQIFREVVPIREGIANFTEKFEKTFGSFRETNAIFVYAAKLKSDCEDGDMLLKTLASHVEEVLEGQFPNCRYKGTDHLNSVFGSQGNLKDEWMKGEVLPFRQQVLNNKEEIKDIDFQKELLRSFSQNHVESKTYPQLFEILTNPEKGSKMIHQLKKLMEEAQEKEKKPLLLQLKLIQLLKENDSGSILQEAIELLPNEDDPHFSLQFNEDIRGMYRSLKERAKIQEIDEGWTIQDTDDLCDLFQCGTEVEGSCQNINGDPKLNKCLLAYIMDGKNRILVIKDSEAKIKVRAVSRILLDENTKKPVLFLERIYPALASSELKDALKQFAIRRSQALKLPLLSKEVGKGKEYSGNILSLGSKAPFEYVDGGNGIAENGKYVLSVLHEVS